jgi:hypothetical protein
MDGWNSCNLGSLFLLKKKHSYEVKDYDCEVWDYPCDHHMGVTFCVPHPLLTYSFDIHHL